MRGEVDRDLSLVPGEWKIQGPGDGPPLTVVTVVRRAPQALGRTLAALVAAGFAECDVVVIEGDDRDSESGRELRRQFFPEFRHLSWLLAPDGGVYDAMNRGMAAARGEWIWFVNAGDLVPVECSYDLLVRTLRGFEEDWAIASARVSGGAAWTPPLKSAQDFSVEGLRRGRHVPCHQAVFVRRLALAGVSGFDARYRISADYELFLKLAQRTDPAIWDTVVIDYEGGGISQASWRRRNLEAALARHRLLPRQNLGVQIVESVRLARRLVMPTWLHHYRSSRRWRESGVSDPKAADDC